MQRVYHLIERLAPKNIPVLIYARVRRVDERSRDQLERSQLRLGTVDVESLDDGKVTLRDRDTMDQDRVEASKLKQILEEKFK